MTTEIKQTEKAVATNDSSNAKAVTRQRYVVKPAVDVYESDEKVTLYVDMPGVSANDLEIEVKDNILSVNGSASVKVPEDMKTAYAEYRAPDYRRTFTLSNKLDQEHIDASMKDGVLTLVLAKAEAAKPRRIEVKTAA